LFCGRSASFSLPQHKTRATGLTGAHSGLQDQILLNLTKIENAFKVRKKTFDFCYG